MQREEIVEKLRFAKAAHVKWVQKAKLLISGIDIDKEAIPVNSTDCKFGKWFYTDGQILNHIPNIPTESIRKLEKLHSKLHDKYLQIFYIYFPQKKKGFFSKLFNSNKKKILTMTEVVSTNNYYDELEIISQELRKELNSIERRVIAISQEAIKDLL